MLSKEFDVRSTRTAAGAQREAFVAAQPVAVGRDPERVI